MAGVCVSVGPTRSQFQQDSTVKFSRIPELDLLRFLAAIAVVFFHYAFRGYAGDDLTTMHYPALEPVALYGFLGVHLFFMISGFVILMTAGDGSVKRFIASRASRLLPAFWVCCTITFFVTLAIGGDRFTATWPQYLVNLVTLGGGFGADPIDGAYWSLGAELRFYRLVGILLIIGQIHRAERWLYVWLIGTVLVELFPFIKLKGFLVTDYAGFFIAGAACFLIRARGLSRSRVALVSAAWGLSLYHEFQLLPYFSEHFEKPLNPAVVAVVMSTFFVVMLVLALRRTPMLTSSRWVWFGALSYPLYLIHQNVGYMLFNEAGAAVDQVLMFWGVVVAAIGAALLLYIVVEKPTAGPMKRGVLHALDALKRYVPARVARWRHDKIRRSGIASRAPRL
ncbi:acyltransferase [Burkholderia cepacia]|nr:acyltransferase [Burkholderia cepacia]MBY4736667.1 acyltransferase [Burkholderia cepacia]MBY4747972.1 acyltransferase [Burkholderia cepacia]MBY4759817.1 acyltransferase [Burkholderia cepacia]MBY4774878.1 acyltransferase [Burkholderia cepacia]